MQRERALAEARRAGRAAGSAGVADDAGRGRRARTGDAAGHDRGGVEGAGARGRSHLDRPGADRRRAPDSIAGRALPADSRSHERPRRRHHRGSAGADRSGRRSCARPSRRCRRAPRRACTCAWTAHRPTVRIPRVGVARVLTTLLKNALDASPAGRAGGDRRDRRPPINCSLPCSDSRPRHGRGDAGAGGRAVLHHQAAGRRVSAWACSSRAPSSSSGADASRCRRNRAAAPLPPSRSLHDGHPA